MFIVFEGIDGSGKTTQIKLLSAYFSKQNIDHIITKEPGGTDVGEQIRSILLSKDDADTGKNDMDPVTEAYLFAASRAEHVRKVIRPALQSGKTVICDRFVDSSIAYQSAARMLGDELIKNINAPAIDGTTPDITFLLDIDPDSAYIYGQPDRIEKQGSTFQEKVRAKYLQLAKNNSSYFIIDGTLSKEQIHNHIINSL